ncbi:ATP-binding protein [Gottfriedia sp. NPDC056225]|uniref:ATP-binding protein n=1 Tax=Gottfriedia sp. NPDC056225 TaxID=3345751 RepID=UPI0015592BAB|nr:HAMP domain-containing protein [Arthrobacter citreus]
MILRSLVGKLWLTIILLVSLVLSFLTFVLIGFFEKFYIDLQVQNMKDDASKIAQLIENGQPISNIEYLSNNIVSRYSRVIISIDGQKPWYSNNTYGIQDLPFKEIQNDDVLDQTLTKDKEVSKRLVYGENSEREKLVVGVPLNANAKNGAVFVYQTLQPVKVMIHQTTNFVLLAASIGIVLTTFFSFFLSSKITAPLRKMKEVVGSMTSGNFNVKVPIHSSDEIGELAYSFNKMSKQLNFNMNALKQEKEKVSNIITSMVDGVISIDNEGRIITTNPPAERFLKMLNDDYFEEETSSLVLTKELLDLFELVVVSEKKQFIELNFDQGNWQVLMSPLYNQTNIRGVVAVIRDVTEQRRLEKMRKDFIAHVSHELRTPISLLQGYSEAIVDGVAESKEEMQELSQIIYDESLRMGRLVNDLLDLARMENGFTELNRDHVPLIQFVDRILRKFKGLAKEKNIKLFGEIDNVPHVDVYIDEDRMEQVFTNLIDNAIRHTNENGRIIVSVSQNETSTIFRFIDSGAGISSEDLPFVFERFYKADKARTRGRSGTGLGLAIVKNIVNAHGGSIKVSSEIGHGTTFKVKIPHDLRMNEKDVE